MKANAGMCAVSRKASRNVKRQAGVAGCFLLAHSEHQILGGIHMRIILRKNASLSELSQTMILKMFEEEKGITTSLITTHTVSYYGTGRVKMSLSSSPHRSAVSGGYTTPRCGLLTSAAPRLTTSTTPPSSLHVTTEPQRSYWVGDSDPERKLSQGDGSLGAGV